MKWEIRVCKIAGITGSPTFSIDKKTVFLHIGYIATICGDRFLITAAQIEIIDLSGE